MAVLEAEFLEKQKGLELLMRCIQTMDWKIQEKSASLIRHLVAEGKVTSSMITKNNLVANIDLLFSRRDIESSGIQLGELGSSMALTFVENHKDYIAKHEKQRSELRTSCESRIRYLDSFPSRSRDEDAILRDMLEHEREMLTAIVKMC
eukprot:Selendium_serpulae@DN5186_c0_g1_i2.p1